MDVSIFLAKLLGLYMLIIAGAWIVRKEQLDHSFKDFFLSKGVIVLSGLINILFGLAIAIGHNQWQPSWVGLITLLGYVMIIKGIVRLIFPEIVQEKTLHIMQKGYWAILSLLIILGGYLTYAGFILG